MELITIPLHCAPFVPNVIYGIRRKLDISNIEAFCKSQT
jgi:hypothetical protein